MPIQIRTATERDAALIHRIMIEAFDEYREHPLPSGALEETAESVARALRETEQAVIGYWDGVPAGMIRFREEGDGLMFHRLSVVPSMRRRGVAASLVHWLEARAKEIGKHRLICRVRVSVDSNVRLYHSLGFQVEEENVVQKPTGQSIRVLTMVKRFD